MINTNRDDIDKAAKKILTGMKRIDRFINQYSSLVSDKDYAEMKSMIEVIHNKLRRERLNLLAINVCSVSAGI